MQVQLGIKRVGLQLPQHRRYRLAQIGMRLHELLELAPKARRNDQGIHRQLFGQFVDQILSGHSFELSGCDLSLRGSHPCDQRLFITGPKLLILLRI